MTNTNEQLNDNTFFFIHKALYMCLDRVGSRRHRTHCQHMIQSLTAELFANDGKENAVINYSTFEWKRLNVVLFNNITINHYKQ